MLSTPAIAQFLLTVPKIELEISAAQDPTDATTTLVIFGLLTVLSLTPSILILMTSFAIVIVLSFVRNALGASQMPPNQALIGLALFLTFYVMSSVFSVAYNEGISPYLDGDIPVKMHSRRSYHRSVILCFLRPARRTLSYLSTCKGTSCPRRLACCR